MHGLMGMISRTANKIHGRGTGNYNLRKSAGGPRRRDPSGGRRVVPDRMRQVVPAAASPQGFLIELNI
jgi:hypothetical protein